MFYELTDFIIFLECKKQEWNDD